MLITIKLICLYYRLWRGETHMFRKWMISAIAVCMLCSGVVCASETETEKTEEKEFEAVSSASVTDYYGDFALSGDELMEAVNGPSGSYVVSTVNEDGSPLAGFFVFSMSKDADTHYVLLGLAENQTRENLERTGKAMALYAANPDKDAPAQYAVSGARMELELVTDEELTEKLNTTGYDTTMICEVKSVRSLG